MKKRFSLLLVAVLAAAVSGCFRLDANLFSADNTIDGYHYDDYTVTDDWDVIPDSSLAIADTNMHLFTLDSKGPGESAPTKIYALYLGNIADIATDTVIMYCHGNYGHMDVYWQRAKVLANVGHKHRFGVLMMDYRGFGLSEGEPTEDGMYADVGACLDWLQAMGLTDDRLVMYGFSLGSAPATELTAHPQALTPGWLMLEAPFASSEMMAQEGTGLAVPGSFFTNFKIDNAEEIKLVNQPFFWIHGIDDHFLSYENHGMSVWNNYGGSEGVAVAVPGAGHSTVVKTMGIVPYQEAVLDFITHH